MTEENGRRSEAGGTTSCQLKVSRVLQSHISASCTDHFAHTYIHKYIHTYIHTYICDRDTFLLWFPVTLACWIPRPVTSQRKKKTRQHCEVDGTIELLSVCLLESSVTHHCVACEPFWLSCTCCEGIDIVQSDHAPEAGVAQGIFHGNLIRHQGGHQEELEEELEEEVERRVRRDHSSNQTQVRMHG